MQPSVSRSSLRCIASSRLASRPSEAADFRIGIVAQASKRRRIAALGHDVAHAQVVIADERHELCLIEAGRDRNPHQRIGIERHHRQNIGLDPARHLAANLRVRIPHGDEQDIPRRPRGPQRCATQ